MTQALVNSGWEEDYQAIRNSAYLKEFGDEFNAIAGNLLHNLAHEDLLTQEEVDRSEWKIELLTPFITRMTINMMKGSIKYTSDDWSAETWQDMGMDDKADSINYELLFNNYLRKEGKI